MKIAIFCPNLIGDTVMATPTIRAIRTRHPDARLSAIIRPSVAPVLDGNPWFDDVILSHHKSKNADQRTAAVVQRLRREPYDVAVLLPNSFRVAWISWLAGIHRRVGYVRYGRGMLLTDSLQPPRDDDGNYLPVPIVNYYAALARLIDCPVDSVQLELGTTARDEAAADRAWAELGLSDNPRVVCLNTGGAFGPAKNWPVESFGMVARNLAETDGVSVLVLCGPAERDSARKIVELADHPKVVSLADQPLSLGLSKAAVRRASLLITTDSGPRHFAAAFQTPVISLFGPTHIAWTRTYHPQAMHLMQPVPCGPCQRPVCSEGHHRCMKDLTPERVLAAARRMLPPPGKNQKTQEHSRREARMELGFSGELFSLSHQRGA